MYSSAVQPTTLFPTGYNPSSQTGNITSSFGKRNKKMQQ